MKQKASIGIIIGNRDFFPDKLVAEARLDVIDQFEKLKLDYVILGEENTKLGGVETFKDAQKCAELFKKNADEINGVLVILPNFGDERGVAKTLKLADLNVPVLIQAYPDELTKLDVVGRRDSWCGKISVFNNLYQFGIKYMLTNKHVLHPKDPAFAQELTDFVAVCREVRGLRKVRIGAVGARSGRFNTVRYSEKILQRNGIFVTTVDLSEILSNVNKLTKDHPEVKEHLDKILAYAPKGKTSDLDAMQKDTGVPIQELMVNGGITVNNFVMDFLTDLLDNKVIKSTMPDVSVLGAAYLAGLGAGVFKNLQEVQQLFGQRPALTSVKYLGVGNQYRFLNNLIN